MLYPNVFVIIFGSVRWFHSTFMWLKYNFFPAPSVLPTSSCCANIQPRCRHVPGRIKCFFFVFLCLHGTSAPVTHPLGSFVKFLPSPFLSSPNGSRWTRVINPRDSANVPSGLHACNESCPGARTGQNLICCFWHFRAVTVAQDLHFSRVLQGGTDETLWDKEEDKHRRVVPFSRLRK